LLDAQKYPASDVVDLYCQRWDVELFFRDIKTVMGMDILRCKTPDMVHKEILMHLIAYNCIRSLMIESAVMTGVRVRSVSFKGSVQSLRQWEQHLNQRKMSRQEQGRLVKLLLESIAGNIISERPGRSEPRAVKRKPKPYQRLTVPRHEMAEKLKKEKDHAKAA
jgi:hypothetical protein